MQLILDHLEQHVPVTLHGPAMTDEEFLLFCHEHEDLDLETNSRGEIEIMPVAGTRTGARNSELSGQLWLWNRTSKSGQSFDSSTGFRLPNGARRSPDAAWIRNGRLPRPGDPEPVIWTVVPDFVAELRSQFDTQARLHEKMIEWISNGVPLGWLIDPFERTVTVYRPGLTPETISNPHSLAGDGPVAGFELVLEPIWDSPGA
ncbi:MAG: Uma2 family endonuclease [Acidobacteria bacterium]|nr:Uma2 family endonuclease [Acidobacteriota bacterium]